jgi:parvulin-like peptidyl-prolyl isomerase
MTYLRQGEPFTEIVKKYSEETLGKSGGYTGFMGEKDLDQTIWNKLNSLQKWHYTSAEVKGGYYIFRYYDTQEVVLNKEFTEVEDEIWKIVMEQKKQDVFQNIVEELKRKADISISL